MATTVTTKQCMARVHSALSEGGYRSYGRNNVGLSNDRVDKRIKAAGALIAMIVRRSRGPKPPPSLDDLTPSQPAWPLIRAFDRRDLRAIYGGTVEDEQEGQDGG